MRAQTFQLALGATARVACAVALVGCVPKAAAPADPLGPSETSAEAVPDEASEPAAESASGDEADPSLAECRERVDEAFGERATSKPDVATAACCEDIAQHYDSVDLEGMERWETRSECCALLSWQGSTACTPWGPPCPPAMPAVDAAAAAAQVA